MFKHFLITRFNLKKQGWDKSKKNLPVLTPEWLKERFELFENFCFPSVKGQTNQNFTWLVYFDKDTPQIFKSKISDLSQIFSNFSPRYIKNMEAFVPAIQNELIETDSPYLITSRLDNDDCISHNFIEEIQKRFSKKEHLALDFADGYTLQINNHYRLGKKRHLWNPFISLIEENNNPKSVWQKNHAEWKLDPLVERINRERVWMSIIHEHNKVNQFTGYGKAPSSVLYEFRINTTVKERIISQLEPNKNWFLLNAWNYINTHFKCRYKDLKRAIRLKKNY